MTHEGFLTPGQIAERFPESHSSREIRALTRLESHPLPHIKRGSKRPVVGIRPSVYELYLEYEMGVISYGEVVRGARRDTEGVR